MDELEKLNEILDDVGDPSGLPVTLKRLIKSSRKRFRPKSPNDVRRLTYVSTLLYLTGDQSSAEKVLEFISANTGEYTCGRRDLAVELAMARVVWSHLLRKKGMDARAREILSLPEIDASGVLRNIEPTHLSFLIDRSPGSDYKDYKVGESLVSDILLDLHLAISVEEDCEDNTAGDKLRSCFHGFLDLVVIRERSFEIRDRISKDDDLLLDEGIEIYLNKMTSYLK